MNGLKMLFQAYRNSRIRTKIILSFIAVNLLLSISIGYIFYWNYSRVIQREITKNVRSTLTRLALDLSKTTGRVVELSDAIVIDPEIRTILLESSEYNDFEKQFNDYKLIGERYSAYPYNPSISSVRMYLWNSFNSIRRPLAFQNIREAATTDWYYDAYRLNGNYHWTDVKEQVIKNDIGEHVVSCVRMIKEYSRQEKVLAYVVIDVKERVLYDLLRETEKVINGDIYLVNNMGTILSSRNTTDLGQNLFVLKELPEGADLVDSQTVTTVQSIQSVVITENIPNLDWKIVTVLSVQELYRTTRETLLALLNISLLAFLLSLVLTGLLSRSITGKIRQLINHIHQLDFEKNDFIPMQVKYQDEVSELVHAFNRMAMNNQNLVNEVYKKGIESKNAEIKMLQAEINPHFLYNALDTANWMAHQHQATDIMKYLQLLSRFYRLSLSGGQSVVSIRTEIDHVKSYIRIIQVKDDDVIEADFQIDEQILDYAIPKMVLQPFVENAIVHGIQETDHRNGKIVMHGSIQGSMISLTICDNGIGMPESTLAKVNALLQDGKDLTDSYGLKNVYIRLQLFFCSKSQIQISSQQDIGTKVVINIPAVPLGKENSDQ